MPPISSSTTSAPITYGGRCLIVAVEHAGDQVGVDLDAGKRLADRRRAQVEQPRRGGADERDLARSRVGRDAVGRDVGEREIAEAAARAAIRNQRGGGLVDRNLQAAEPQPLEAGSRRRKPAGSSDTGAPVWRASSARTIASDSAS